MADGTDHNYNFPATRGAKLRHQGSNPTGSQTQSFKPEYSDDMDYAQGAPAIGKRTRINEAQHNPKPASGKLRGETGLIFKEPLS